MARPKGQFNKNKNDLFRLIQYLNSMGTSCFATNEYLSQKIGKSVRQIKRYLSELKKEKKISTTYKVLYSHNPKIKVGFYEKREITCSYIINRVKIKPKLKWELLPMPKGYVDYHEERQAVASKYDYKKHKANINQAKEKFIKNITKDLTFEQIEELKKYNYDTDAWVEAIRYKWSAEGIAEEARQYIHNLRWGEEEAAQKAKEEQEAKERELSYKLTPEDQSAFDKWMEEAMQKRLNGEYDHLDKELDEMKKKGLI